MVSALTQNRLASTRLQQVTRVGRSCFNINARNPDIISFCFSSNIFHAVDLLSDDSNKCVVVKESKFQQKTFKLPDGLLKRMPLIDIRNIPIQVYKQPGNVNVNNINARLPMKYHVLPEYIRNRLMEMAITHSLITKKTIVRGRIGMVRGVPCPNWHVDKVTLRSLCALHGPGPDLRSDHLCVSDGGYVTSFVGDDMKSTEEGDVVLMRGIGIDEKMKHLGTFHRSPTCTSSVPRLIVQVDCVDDSV